MDPEPGGSAVSWPRSAAGLAGMLAGIVAYLLILRRR